MSHYYDTLKELFKRIFSFLIGILLISGFVVVILKITQSAGNYIFIAAIVMCFAIFLSSLFYITGRNFYKSFEKLGADVLLPLSILCGVTVMAIYCFGALSGLLSDLGYINFTPQLDKKNFGPLTDLYLWHLLDLVPQIKIQQTLQWKVPFAYDSKIMSWLLLTYKAIMIFVIISQFVKWGKWRKEIKKTNSNIKNVPD